MTALTRPFRRLVDRSTDGVEPAPDHDPVEPATDAPAEIAAAAEREQCDLAVDIPEADPLFAYLQSAPGPVDVGRLELESPAVQALRDADVALVVPLVTQGELIGTLNLGPRLSEQDYSTDDRRLLATLAAQAAPAIRVAQLVREQAAEAAEKERLAQELRVATLIQQQFLPRELRGRFEVLQWLFWQVGGLGPMTGQHGHFGVYAPQRFDYAIARYARESERLLGVLDRQLQGRAFIAGDAYSIADMACYPWISPYDKAPLDLSPFPEVRRWHAAIAARPATQRAYALGGQVNPDAGKPMTDEEKKILFGQGAR